MLIKSVFNVSEVEVYLYFFIRCKQKKSSPLLSKISCYSPVSADYKIQIQDIYNKSIASLALCFVL